jgi:hypothetical protein
MDVEYPVCVASYSVCSGTAFDAVALKIPPSNFTLFPVDLAAYWPTPDFADCSQFGTPSQYALTRTYVRATCRMRHWLPAALLCTASAARNGTLSMACVLSNTSHLLVFDHEPFRCVWGLRGVFRTRRVDLTVGMSSVHVRSVWVLLSSISRRPVDWSSP